MSACGHSHASEPGLHGHGLEAALAAIDVPASERKMRSSQLYHWLYVRGAKSPASMTNVSKSLRARLEAAYTMERPEIVA